MPDQMFASPFLVAPWRRAVRGLTPLLEPLDTLEDEDDLTREQVEALRDWWRDEAHAPVSVWELWESVDRVWEAREALEAGYDWADRARVWIDPTAPEAV